MGVLPIISLMFAEILVVFIGLAGFLFLFGEYLKRRKFLLLWSSLYFLVFCAAFGALFFGQIISSYSPGPASDLLVYAPNFLFPLAAVFLLWLLVETDDGGDGRFWHGIALVISAISMIAAWHAPKNIVQVEGLAVSELDLSWWLMIFGAWFFAIGASMIATRWSIRRNERASVPTAADRAMFSSGAFGLAFMSSTAAAITLRLEFFFLISVLLLASHLIFLFFGASAKNNPDPAIAKRPLNIISKRLILKAAVLNVVLFWMLAVGLLAVTSNYFLSALSVSREISRRRDLHYLTKSYASLSMNLLEETMRLASLASVADMARTKSGEPPAEVNEFLKKDAAGRVFRIIDSKGKVVYSSFSPSEIGTNMLGSSVVGKALKGLKVAAAEKEMAFDRWMVRAAVPISGSDGRYVLMSTGVSASFDLTDYVGIDASGYGFIADTGEAVYVFGRTLDSLTRLLLQWGLGSANTASGDTEEGLVYSVERVFATDGTPDGFFYIYLLKERMNSEIVRILSVVIFLTILALMVITAVLTLSISIVLRPIKELHAVAGEIEREKFEVRIKYDSADELGALARAINRMGTTIGERTSNLREALETQKDFLAHTAHEMRTPLNIFRWTLELLRFGDVGRLNKEQMELLEQLHQTNERLVTMIDNLRIASRLEQSGMILKRSFFSIEDLIDEAAGALAVKMREKNIALHWRHPDESLPKPFADRDRVMQILLNLFSNAAKYTQRSGHVEVFVKQAGESAPGSGIAGKFVQVTVEDSGMGIPKDEQARIFTRFFRSSSVQKTEIEGTGLGLFIAKQLVELHGGRIWFQSEEGTGSIFHFTLPTEKTYDSQSKQS